MPKVKLDYHYCNRCLLFEFDSKEGKKVGYCTEFSEYVKIFGKPCDAYMPFDDCDEFDKLYELIDTGQEYVVS